jgi:aldose 1-epimerase
MSVSIEKRAFGRLPDGTAVDLFVLTNSAGVSVSVMTYGAIITSVQTPDRNGRVGEISLARNTLEEYLGGHPYYGALVGRVCNRISHGGFTLDETFHPVANNAGELHLHGGVKGFDRQIYRTEVEADADRGTVHFVRVSPDGEEGYPGNLSLRYSVTLDEGMRLTLRYEATTDRPTVVNLTNHCYWNLSGEPAILGHEMRIPASRVLEMAGMIPTGQFLPVAGTGTTGAFDFTDWKAIGRDIAALEDTAAGGYDHSYAIDGWEPDASGEVEPVLRPAAEVRSGLTGRTLSVRTSYPAVHFYSGNNLPGEIGRNGETLTGREAFCLECQFFPDSPNRPEFPSIRLEPGETYRHVTEHTFGVM